MSDEVKRKVCGQVTEHPEWLDHLDAPTSAPAWPRVLASVHTRDRVTPARVPGAGHHLQQLARGAGLGAAGAGLVRRVLETAAADILALEDRLNILDSGSGDGDCGSTLAAGARAIR